MSDSYYTRSQPTYDAHRKMLDDFYKKYPALAENAEKNLTMLYPDSTFQPIFDGLEKDAPVKELKCPGAPKRSNKN